MNKDKQRSWDISFLEVAKIIANHSTCASIQVGCVIVRDKRIISIGYNGTPAGVRPHCNEKFNKCDLNYGAWVPEMHHIVDRNKKEHFKFQQANEIHAEINAIAYAARETMSTRNTTLYSTWSPCKDCCKAIISAGIIRVVYKNKYEKDTTGLELLKKCNIPVVEINIKN